MPSLQVLSLGGGVQSSGIVEMVVEGVLDRLDAVIFADTHGEMPETYTHVAYLADRLATVGIPLMIVSNGSLEQHLIEAGNGTRSRMPSIPARILGADGSLQRVNQYYCSYDYKRQMVERTVKRLCGPKAAWRTSDVRQWIGYSTDEASRIKQPLGCRCGHQRAAHRSGPCSTTVGDTGRRPCTRGCQGFEAWQTNRFPLIEANMSRVDVQRWLTAHQLPTPPPVRLLVLPESREWALAGPP